MNLGKRLALLLAVTSSSFENAQGGSLSDSGEVVKADGAIVAETRLDWASLDRLIVQFSEASIYEVRSKLLRDPVTHLDGTENVIAVEVTNRDYSEQKRSCE